MSIEVEAVYENGTLKLDRLLPLEHQQRVRVVVQEELSVPGQSAKSDNWWPALQEIRAGQAKRGFVGTVTEVDRSDQGYDEQMREIVENTIHAITGG